MQGGRERSLGKEKRWYISGDIGVGKELVLRGRRGTVVRVE